MQRKNTYYIEREFLKKINNQELVSKIIFLKLREYMEK